MTPKWMPLDNSESLKKNVKKCNKHLIFNRFNLDLLITEITTEAM